jgi:pilus assembly protein Flp/PilA
MTQEHARRPREQEWRIEMAGFATHFLRDETGATAIEYGLIAAFIFLAIVSVLTQVGSNLNAVFTSVNNGLD